MMAKLKYKRALSNSKSGTDQKAIMIVTPNLFLHWTPKAGASEKGVSVLKGGRKLRHQVRVGVVDGPAETTFDFNR